MSGVMILGLIAPLGLNFIITDRLFDLGPVPLVVGRSVVIDGRAQPDRDRRSGP